MEKSIEHLTPQDFHDSPAWMPVDDLCDPELLVQPYDAGVFHLEEMILVAARFRLADGSHLQGYLRFSWGKPIEFAIADREGSFVIASVKDRTDENSRELAALLGRRHADVFPIEYETAIALRICGNAY